MAQGLLRHLRSANDLTSRGDQYRLLAILYALQSDDNATELAEAATGLQLAIGGLGVAVHCDDGPTQEGLRGRYAAWLAGGPAHCQVTVACGGGAPAAGQVTPLASFDAEGMCRLAAPGYQGTIAADVRSARLRLAAPDAAGVDYFLRAVLALLAHAQGGLLLHAAGILRQGRAFLFSGQSGVGKSTTVRISAQLAGAAALGDDLILLLPQDEVWLAHSTPFWNPETPASLRTAEAESGPLAAILRLVQDKRSFVRPLGRAQAVAGLLGDIPLAPLDGRRVPALLARLARVADAAPVAQLHFRPDLTLWSSVDAFVKTCGAE